jgi:uncharacterized protein YkwD
MNEKQVSARWKFVAAIFAGIAALCIQTSALSLELRIHNDFDQKMFVAIVYFDAHHHILRTSGWFSVEPRSEERVIFEASKTEVYLYAELSGASTTWGKGDIVRTATNNVFSYYDGEECPVGSERRSLRFTKYEAQNDVLEFRPIFSESDAPIWNAGDGMDQTIDNDVTTKVDLAKKLLMFINTERRKAGVPELVLTKALSEAANRRASELTIYYSHDRPDGSKLDTIFAEFILSPSSYAENISWKSGSRDFTSLASFNKGFMDSPRHRENMLNRNYSAVGLGFAISGDRYYVSELFADLLTEHPIIKTRQVIENHF